VSEPTSTAGWVAIIIALCLPAMTTWAVIRNTNLRHEEASVRFEADLQRRIESQDRELDELRGTVDAQSREIESMDRELRQMEEAFD
jgi:predicted RNase H-like nuclease (RuvC/YqgF family)